MIYRRTKKTKNRNKNTKRMQIRIGDLFWYCDEHNVGDFVVASDGRFKGVQEIVSIRKEPDNRIVYLIQNIWCCSNDIKKWIPEVNEKVVITAQLAQINPGSFDGYGMTRYYTVIMKVKELKQDNTVILEDYSSVKVQDLIPLSKYKGN